MLHWGAVAVAVRAALPWLSVAPSWGEGEDHGRIHGYPWYVFHVFFHLCLSPFTCFSMLFIYSDLQ